MSGGIEETYELACLRKSSFGYTSRFRTIDLGPKTQLTADSFWNILITARKKHSVIGCNIELKKF
jgi:hypothetical protein